MSDVKIKINVEIKNNKGSDKNSLNIYKLFYRQISFENDR